MRPRFRALQHGGADNSSGSLPTIPHPSQGVVRPPAYADAIRSARHQLLLAASTALTGGVVGRNIRADWKAIRPREETQMMSNRVLFAGSVLFAALAAAPALAEPPKLPVPAHDQSAVGARGFFYVG